MNEGGKTKYVLQKAEKPFEFQKNLFIHFLCTK